MNKKGSIHFSEEERSTLLSLILQGKNREENRPGHQREGTPVVLFFRQILRRIPGRAHTQGTQSGQKDFRQDGRRQLNAAPPKDKTNSKQPMKQLLLTLAALYAPLDGMNEAGLAVSVNMIQDSAAIEQNTDKPDITTTTAIRLLLDQAGNVDKALELLGQYDLHGSMGMMIHFAIAWYCENVTFENCKIIGTQPLCYCKGLKLVGCEMIDCDLAFERSEVEATITTPVLSIKNPLAGSRIMVPAVGEIIRDMKEGTGTVQVQGQEPESVSACA